MDVNPKVISANIARWLKDQRLKQEAKSSPLLKPASPGLVLPKFKPLSVYEGEVRLAQMVEPLLK